MHPLFQEAYIVTGMQVGAKVSFLQFMLNNEVPVTLGNFLAGFFFLGVVAWLSYDARFPWNAKKDNLLEAEP